MLQIVITEHNIHKIRLGNIILINVQSSIVQSRLYMHKDKKYIDIPFLENEQRRQKMCLKWILIVVLVARVSETIIGKTNFKCVI